MKKGLLLFSMVMAIEAVANAQQKPPAPKVETVKFAPPRIVPDSNGNARTKKSPKVEQVKFAKHKNNSKAKSEKVPNQ